LYYDIDEGTFTDPELEKEVVTTRNEAKNRLGLVQGIELIDFKFPGYDSDKMMIHSIEYKSPPMLIINDSFGVIVTYYLLNEMKGKCILKNMVENNITFTEKVITSLSQKNSSSQISEDKERLPRYVIKKPSSQSNIKVEQPRLDKPNPEEQSKPEEQPTNENKPEEVVDKLPEEPPIFDNQLNAEKQAKYIEQHKTDNKPNPEEQSKLDNDPKPNELLEDLSIQVKQSKPQSLNLKDQETLTVAKKITDQKPKIEEDKKDDGPVKPKEIIRDTDRLIKVDDRKVEEDRKKEEDRKVEEDRKKEEDRKADEDRKKEEKRKAEEDIKKKEEEKLKKEEEDKRKEKERLKKEEEDKKREEEKHRAEEDRRRKEEKEMRRKEEERLRKEEENRKLEEERRRLEETKRIEEKFINDVILDLNNQIDSSLKFNKNLLTETEKLISDFQKTLKKKGDELAKIFEKVTEDGTELTNHKTLLDLTPLKQKLQDLYDKKDTLLKIKEEIELTATEDNIDSFICPSFKKQKHDINKLILRYSKKLDDIKTFYNDYIKLCESNTLIEVNQKLEHNNKFGGMFKKFTQKTISSMRDKHTPNNYQSNMESSIYKEVMKYLETQLIDIEDKLIKQSHRLDIIKTEITKGKKPGLSIGNNDATVTFNRAEKDLRSLGTNSFENPILEKQLSQKIINNLPIPVLQVVELDGSDNIEDFFSKSNGVKKESYIPVYSSKNYLDDAIRNIKAKISEKDKLYDDIKKKELLASDELQKELDVLRQENNMKDKIIEEYKRKERMQAMRPSEIISEVRKEKIEENNNKTSAPGKAPMDITFAVDKSSPFKSEPVKTGNDKDVKPTTSFVFRSKQNDGVVNSEAVPNIIPKKEETSKLSTETNFTQVTFDQKDNENKDSKPLIPLGLKDNKEGKKEDKQTTETVSDKPFLSSLKINPKPDTNDQPTDLSFNKFPFGEGAKTLSNPLIPKKDAKDPIVSGGLNLGGAKQNTCI
jgi:hypothetical protein